MVPLQDNRTRSLEHATRRINDTRSLEHATRQINNPRSLKQATRQINNPLSGTRHAADKRPPLPETGHPAEKQPRCLEHATRRINDPRRDIRPCVSVRVMRADVDIQCRPRGFVPTIRDTLYKLYPFFGIAGFKPHAHLCCSF